MSKRILVIEDQEDNRQILRDLLTSADFEVIEAVDGERGLPRRRRIGRTSFSWTSSCRSSTATRRRAASRQTQCCMPSPSSPSPPMRWAGILRRHVPRVAMPTFPSLTARVSSWRSARALVPARANEVIERDLCTQVHEVRNGSIASFLPCLPFVRSSSQTGHGS